MWEAIPTVPDLQLGGKSSCRDTLCTTQQQWHCWGNFQGHRHPNSPFRLTCSGLSWKRGCICHSKSLNEGVRVATQSWTVSPRATPPERVVAHIFREEGHERPGGSQRPRELKSSHKTSPASGHAVGSGRHFAWCVECRRGSPSERCATQQGDHLPELVASRRCKLVVLAIETGGRWSEEAAKAREVPSCMRNVFWCGATQKVTLRSLRICKSAPRWFSRPPQKKKEHHTK